MAAARRVRVGSRSSLLSLAQTNEVISLLRRAHPGLAIDTLSLSTRGDRNKSAPLLSMERGMFVKEIEGALLNGDIDLAVHSAKDMPAAMPPGLAIAAYTERQDARDALVNRWGLPLSRLPAGARIGTSSPRRISQLKAARPDIAPLPIRGNVDTRLRKAAGAEYDGAALAAAGLMRLGRRDEISAYLSPEECVPDVGQGALAVQVRADDADMLECARAIDHAPTSAAVRAERAFLEAMGGGCTLPTAAYARIRGDGLHILAMVAMPDGSEIVRLADTYAAADPGAAGRAIAAKMMDGGARRILEDGRETG